ncbi:MAG: hypothetical protein HRT73_14325, partial [Flavobacteriales bacterium]|nr:hypothetical protein [Flavobacteriales bacterium]
MSKRNKKYQATASAKTFSEQKIETNQAKSNFSINDMSNIYLWGVTVFLAIIYFIFSTFSDGFYMHDEPMFYMYAKDFLKDPIHTFSGFQRIGYVTFLVLPALGGFTFLNFFNSVLAAITVMYAYKIVRKLGGGNSFLIFFLLGLQPLWFMLAFRNYSEFFVAFLMVMTIWNHLNKKYIFAALLLSYAAVSRIEYHTLLGFYFIVLVYKKQWLPAVLTGTFTLLHNVLGFILTDDLLYLPNKIMDYSERMSGSWPKRGFDHYLTMSNVIFGGVTLTLFVSYLSLKILKKEKPQWIITGATLFVILFNCLINWQSVEIGPGNAGNLRYFIPIAPFVAILGVLAIDDILKFQKKYLLLFFLIPFLLLIGIYQTYDHNFIGLMDGMVNGEYNEAQETKLWYPLIFALITTALLILPLAKKHYLMSLVTLTIIVAVFSARTFNLNPEDATMKKAGKWYTQY